MATKKETPAEINKRVMAKFKSLPKGAGEAIGRYEKRFDSKGNPLPGFNKDGTKKKN